MVVGIGGEASPEFPQRQSALTSTEIGPSGPVSMIETASRLVSSGWTDPHSTDAVLLRTEKEGVEVLSESGTGRSRSDPFNNARTVYSDEAPRSFFSGSTLKVLVLLVVISLAFSAGCYRLKASQRGEGEGGRARVAGMEVMTGGGSGDDEAMQAKKARVADCEEEQQPDPTPNIFTPHRSDYGTASLLASAQREQRD